ncbi:MAG: proliferating cell nuclear antigen (pcna) [Nanoarchaeota archaeon]|nr:proliferating cell nuclear antigen (pcna) [Nanoarchaeota archaeon]
MELILENAKLFKKSMEIISDIVLEGTFVFKQDYMELVALNSNNVVMVIFRLLSTNFEKYEVEEDKQISLSLEHLSQVLKSCDESGKLTLKIDDNGKLELISEGKNKKEFALSLIEFNDDNLQKIPNLSFPVKIVSSSANFTNAISDLSFIEEGVSCKVENSGFFMEGKTNSMSGKIEFSENVDVQIKEEKNYHCRYSMEYLKKFIKADKLVNTVELSFNDDFPLKVEYKLVDKLLLGFILAPRGEE